MKASELIRSIQEVIEEKGDYDIFCVGEDMRLEEVGPASFDFYISDGTTRIMQSEREDPRL